MKKNYSCFCYPYWHHVIKPIQQQTYILLEILRAQKELYIQRIVDTALVAIDTISIDGSSSFSSDLDLKSPEMLYLFLDRGVSNSLQ
jgi:hypothetical protein